ncbi:hypothetical protein ABNC28_23105 [Paenibacillus larvae]|uniref:Uncharacterized protein n=1 Tax=Paenibacillus larvae TaxID=1464 RepID=A0AAP5JR28_9BACL|nr:hypothetical protein [Paenibacillus larvae]ETK27349.1 hypothetical protein ERIC1_1c07940 [Paenibacillus larvae subsp. larvae DSM 25719]MCY9701651.1 hypothetical protein [Paenibacillus larvae]MCY9711125.1 hypothetical protein [Paenibacillus larvae]MCY9716598.1 hypothetical protein [Paenibacillus larvae]MDT2191251.1 hypothetical protein [Paenibacillus larvae]
MNELQRFIRDGISETLKQEKAFNEEISEVSERIRLGREEMKEASKNRSLIQKAGGFITRG